LEQHDIVVIRIVRKVGMHPNHRDGVLQVVVVSIDCHRETFFGAVSRRENKLGGHQGAAAREKSIAVVNSDEEWIV
jgi:hypothetical protein